MALSQPFFIRRLSIRCSNSGVDKRFDIYVSQVTDVGLLRKYISKVKFIEGRYYFNGDYIDDHVTLITVNNGDTLEVKKFREKKGNLHDVEIEIVRNTERMKKFLVPGGV